MRLSAPSLGMRLVGWFGVRLSAHSLGLRLVCWFGSEAESSLSGNEASWLVLSEAECS